MPICQRTEVPSDGPATYTMEDQGLFLDEYTLWWIGQDGAGTTTWMNSHGSVFQYTAAGEGTHVDDFEGINGASGLVTDAEAVLFPGNALTEALLRVADGVLEVVELESGLHPRGGVRGEDGTLWYAVRDSFEDDATFLYPFDPATLVATGERVGFSPTSMPAEILPLTEHGFVSICSDGSETYTLCVGHGPDDLVEIPAPPFLTEISTAAVRELRRNPTPDDLWWSSEEGIAHWDGASWTVEDDLRPYENPAGLQPLGDGRAVAFLEAPSGEYDALYLDGSCWQPLQPTGAAYSRTLYNGSWDSSLGEIRPDVVGYATSDNDLVSLSVSAFP